MNYLWTTLTDFLNAPLAGSAFRGLHLALVVMALIPLALIMSVYRRQWDRIPGIWRCAVLSLLAHIVLAFYLYGTHYVVLDSQGGKDVSRVVALKVLEATSDESTDQSPPAIAPWDEFTNDQRLPDVEPLERPREEPELILERTWEDTPIDGVAGESQAAEPPKALPPLTLPPMGQLPESPSASSTSWANENPLPPTSTWTESSPTPLEIQRVEINPSETVAPQLDTQDFGSSPPTPATTELDLTIAPPTPRIPAELPAAAPTPPLSQLPLNPISQPPMELAGFRGDVAPSVPPTLPRRWADSQPMPRLYAARTPEQRARAVQEQGGSEQTEQAVERALQYLAAHQLPEGHWSSRLSGGGIERQVLGQDRNGAGSRADCGISGLALLAFLAHGNSQFEGPYRETVARGLQYLSDHQAPDGCLAGNAQLFERMYCHSMALLALSEALAITGDPRLLPIVRRGVEYSVRTQSQIDGGWRYQPGDSGDMSQFGWKVMALHSASLGGVTIPETTVIGMNKFLDLATRGTHDGVGCYRPGEAASATMTAEALVCRYLLRAEVLPATVDEAYDLIRQNPPSVQEINYYYWYYGTMASHHAGGKYWEEWNATLKPLLLSRQIQTGHDAGSWPADGLWCGYGGKVYSTALATLCLQAYYRYVSIQELK